MTQRNNAFSYLRVIAALAIVFLHTFQYMVEAFHVLGNDKIASMCVRNSTLWAVPAFVLVSGALLLNPAREMTYKKLYGKYVLKIVIALFFFFFIYEIVDCFIFDKNINFESFVRWMKALYTGNSWKPLWYLYMLLALYFMLPIYRRAAQAMNRSDFRYIVLVLIIFQSAIPFIERLTGVRSGFYICVYAVYTLYFFAGYAIYKGHIVIRTLVAWILFILSSGANVLLTVLSFKGGLTSVYDAINNYASVIVVIQSLSLFALFINRGRSAVEGNVSNEEVSERPGVFGRLLLSIDKVTLGIYLVHLIILRVIIYAFKFNSYDYGFYMNVLLSIGIFAAAFIVSRILHLIPLVKKII